MTDSLVILTGAGISAESGLETFRDPDGIWATHKIEDVATPRAFSRNPALVQEFYNARRRRLLSPEVKPGLAHLALADLERRWRGSLSLVTQNVDHLHEQAGSRGPIHMHGELLKSRCARSGHVYPCREDLGVHSTCPCCGMEGTLRPHVVWFGEIPLEMDRIDRALSRCDRFIAIGTSGSVYPAAGFVQIARAAGARTIELNLEPTELSHLFDETVHGPASQVVPSYVERLLGTGGA